jgi:hypothetical protein
MKKRYLPLLIALSIVAILLFISWLQRSKPSELDQLRAEGWTIVDLDEMSERAGGFEIDYSKAFDGNPPISAGGVLFYNQPKQDQTGDLRVSRSRPPTAIGIKIVDNRLSLAITVAESIQLGSRTTFQQAIDFVLRRQQPDPILTMGQQRVTLDTSRPAGHTAKLLPIPNNKLPFNQPVRVVEWIPDDPSLPVEYGLLTLEPNPPDPTPSQPPKP